MAINRGDKSTVLSNAIDDDFSLPPRAQTTREIVDLLVLKTQDLITLVEGKADRDTLKSEIAIGDEAIKIQAQEIVLVGNVTIAEIINDQNGTSPTSIDVNLTRVIGNKIQTGSIISNNFGASEGTAIDLDNDQIIMGGTSAPSLFYDGAGNLEISGTLTAGSVIANSVTVDGVTLGQISTDSDTGATHAGITGSNPHNVSQADMLGDLDDIADGATYFKSTSLQNTGGTRGYNALDSAFDYVRTLSTTKIIISGSNPTNGVILDTAGLRMYDGGLLNINLPSNGTAATYSGDIITSGSIEATGLTTASGFTATIVGSTTVVGRDGIAGSSTHRDGVRGGTQDGAGVHGTATVSGDGVKGVSFSLSGRGGYFSSPSIGLEVDGLVTHLNTVLNVSGFTTIDDSCDITGSLDVDGVTNLDVTDIDGTLDVAGATSLHAALTTTSSIKMTSATQNFSIGNAALTGNANICIKEGAAGARLSEQIQIFGHGVASTGDTTLGLVLDQGVEAIGTFTASDKIKIAINAVEYWLALDAV